MSDKTILITRPTGGGAALAEQLHGHGYRVIHEPLTDIYLRHAERQALEAALAEEPDAVIVTSRHGARALALLSSRRDLFLICVGAATAHVAKALGFTHVAAAGGNAQRLIGHILSAYDPGSRFLYASGDPVRVDLKAALARYGMQVNRLALYEAVAAPRLSDTLVAQLTRGQVDAVTLLSPRAGQVFLTLLVAAKAQEALGHLHAVCLSENIAQAVHGAPWKSVSVAGEATLASLIECVDNTLLT